MPLRNIPSSLSSSTAGEKWRPRSLHDLQIALESPGDRASERCLLFHCRSPHIADLYLGDFLANPCPLDPAEFLVAEIGIVNDVRDALDPAIPDRELPTVRLRMCSPLPRWPNRPGGSSGQGSERRHSADGMLPKTNLIQ